MIKRVVRLIRRKGINAYFVTQTRFVLPKNIMGHLGNGVQHELRAITPADQETGKEAAQIFQANSKLLAEKVFMELAGE